MPKMPIFRRGGALLAAWICATTAVAAQEAPRTRTMVEAGPAKIDVIAEGRGPLIVMLPSRGRDSEDFDAVAAGLAKAGFRVVRPQPRGAGASTGPTENVRMQDLAADVAAVIAQEKAGPAVIAGHAYGNWVARLESSCALPIFHGIVLIAAIAKAVTGNSGAVVQQSGDPKLPDETRLAALKRGFFLPGHDASVWLKGWAPAANRIQGAAATATKQAEYWNGGGVKMLDLVPDSDPFKPKEKWNESREEFGDRVTVKIIPNASPLIPEQPAAVVEAIASWMKTL